MEIDSHIELIRPVLNEYLDGPREIRELILTFARWLEEGKYYTQGDLMSIPVDTACLFALNMYIQYACSRKIDVKIHNGEVTVIRNDSFKFKFTMDGVQHDYVRGKYYPCIHLMVFANVQGEELGHTMIGLLPHAFE